VRRVDRTGRALLDLNYRETSVDEGARYCGGAVVVLDFDERNRQ
jgi:hypothetical protein